MKREQTRKRDAEFRLEQLRTARGLAPVSQGEEKAAVELKPVDIKKPAEVESKPGHINLFEGIKIFDPIKVLEKEGGDGKDGFKKNKKMKKEEKPRVVTAEDEKYRLGYGVAGKGVKLPWYLERLSADANGESGEDDERLAKEEKKNKSGKKTLEELREERLKRETREKERERTLILNKRRNDRAAFADGRLSRR